MSNEAVDGYHVKWQIPERPKTAITFPNGATSELDHDAHIDLDEISELTFKDAADAFLNAIRSHSPDHLHGDLYVRVPSAEHVFGIDLGCSRTPPLPTDPDHDQISIFVKDARIQGACILARLPAVKDAIQAEFMLRGAMAPHSVELAELRYEESDNIPYTDATFRVPDGMLMREVTLHCQTAIALLHGGSDLVSSPLAAYRKLSLGTWESLIGELETDWLEVKRKMCGTRDPRQRFEMALDVASMANLDSGGILIIGFETSKNSHGQDVISKASGVSRLQASIPQLNSTIKNLVYPRLDKLLISVFHKDDRDVLAILVPPQPADRRPYLVKSALIDQERLYGNGITWVTRGSDAKQAGTIEEIHRALSGTPPSRSDAT